MGQTSTKQKVYPWLIVIAWSFMACASMELLLINGSQYFKTVSDAIGSPVSEVALMMTFITITISICAPIAGNLFQRFDSRIVLTVMGILALGAYACMSFFTEVWMWWIAGIVLGAGVAGIGIIGAPIFIGNWFQKRTGFAVGLYGMVLAGMSMIIAQVLPIVIKSVGYKPSYLIWAGIGALMYFPWALFVVKFKPEQIGLKPYGFVEGAEEATKNDVVIGPGVAFRKAITSPAFWILLLAAAILCNFGGYKSNWSNIAQSTEWGYDIVFGGTMLLATTACKFISPLVGWISDKIGATLTFVIAYICLAVAFLLMLGFHAIPIIVIIACFLEGFDSISMKMLIPLTVKELFGDKDYSRIYSLLYGIINFLGSFATSLIAFAYEATGSFDIIFIVGALASAIGIVFLLLAKKLASGLVWED
ncbi:MAG: MFS transporter [Coriobacteriales bacterium]|jgi:MFS family permease|nr:MFS transporter [Coriobacteriales bacterium]